MNKIFNLKVCWTKPFNSGLQPVATVSSSSRLLPASSTPASLFSLDPLLAPSPPSCRCRMRRKVDSELPVTAETSYRRSPVTLRKVSRHWHSAPGLQALSQSCTGVCHCPAGLDWNQLRCKHCAYTSLVHTPGLPLFDYSANTTYIEAGTNNKCLKCFVY